MAGSSTYTNWMAAYCEGALEGAEGTAWTAGACGERRLSTDDHPTTNSTDDAHADDAHADDAAHDAGHSEHGTHPQTVLCFMFVGCAIGGVSLWLINHLKINIPYTVLLFVEGIVLACVHEATGKSLGTLSDSIEMWLKIDPHLLLCVVVPAAVRLPPSAFR